MQEKDLSQNENSNIVLLVNIVTVTEANFSGFTFFVLHTTWQIHKDHRRSTVLVCSQALFSL